MSNLSHPSLFADGVIGTTPSQSLQSIGKNGKTMLEQLYDGFYLVFLLKRGHTPGAAEKLRERVRELLDEFEMTARRQGAAADDVYAAKYAYCALLDETILGSNFDIRDEWGRNPLQLAFFGDQLAGENFFVKLDELRSRGPVTLQALTVFHYCLLLGFQGKYLLEAPEKLALLTARLGDEIAFLRGKRNPFAPFWAVPDKINHMLRSDTPLAYIMAGFFVTGVLAFVTLAKLLGGSTQDATANYAHLLQAPPQAAHIVITLP